ncbi:hypothetical protein EBR03_07580 [bacterium]|nr:hypothetical protein [bacterium]
MNRGLLFLFLACISFQKAQSSPLVLGQGLSGNYKLAYIASDLTGIFRLEDTAPQSAESFDYSKIAAPPQVPAIYLFHDPKGPSGTLMGGGFDAPRLCEGEASLVAQELECAPLSKETFKDEASQCSMKKIFVETVSYHIATELRYSRTEIIAFDKETPKECAAYKEQLAEELASGKGPDFFKAMLAAGVIQDVKKLPDTFFLAHIYQATLTDEKAVEVSEGDRTGAYSLAYSGNSKTMSWEGEKKERFKESSAFDAKEKSVAVQRLDNILIFHKIDNNSMRIAGAGLNKIRNCTLASGNENEASSSVFTCTLFKAKEEEIGTGCTIEHWVHEKITLLPKENPRYERVEQRQLVNASSEGCKKYRQKISSEMKEGSAETFFKLLFETGGVSDADSLGDTFQLIHEYTLTPED